MEKRKVILDVDTGSDDAVAIMLAYLHPAIDLVAVCSVAGNQPIENTTENTKRVLDLVHADDVPLYRGCSKALVREVEPWRIKPEMRADAKKDGKKIHIHAKYLNLPESNRKVEKMHAPSFYVKYLSETKEKVTIAAVGPLTNLAVALAIEPKIVKNIEEIVIMGGGCDISNVSSSAEFNIFRDPESAQKVLHCGAKIVMVPLDATHRAVVTKDDCARFEKIGTPAALFAKEMCETRILVHTQQQPLWLPDACALHDPLTIAYIVDPKVLTDVRYCHVDVACEGVADGATIVDQRTIMKNPNVHFCFDADRKKFVNIMCKAFALQK